MAVESRALRSSSARRAAALTSDAVSGLYRASARGPALITVPPLNVLIIDGAGEPEGADFEAAIGALYSLAYTMKFTRKKAGTGPDYRVFPLEGLWGDGPDDRFWCAARATWRWSLLIAQPDFIVERDLDDARSHLGARGKATPKTDLVRLELLDEGSAAQVLHVGPYSEEMPTIERLHRFIADHNLRLRGRHHEIYLGDPRRADPSRLRTILRQPVRSREPIVADR